MTQYRYLKGEMKMEKRMRKDREGKHSGWLRRAALLVAGLAAAFLLAGQDAPPADAWSAASETEEYAISLEGARKDSLGPAYYAKLKASGARYLTKTVESKGVKSTYSGLGLSSIMAMIDGPDSAHPFSFDEALWARGYDITLTAGDGYSATFSTKDLNPDDLILADTKDGKPLEKYMTVGDSPKSLWVKDLASISTSLAPVVAVSEAAAFSLELDINGTKAAFTLAELEKDPAYLEGTGSFTTSAGTRYTNRYGGVKLRTLLDRYMKVTADDSVKFVATDGYEMTYSGRQILDEADGTWLLAFRMDGDWLPRDPGYIRTIKVGPANPDIDGHLSVKMIRKIVVREKDYKDFSLQFSGKMSGSIDRSTVQSCVSCHGKDVAFERKNISGRYTGFPLHLLLAYADDPKYQPHRQGSDIISYDKAAAKAGYKVEVVAEDGFKVVLDSREIDANNDIIVAMYKDGAGLAQDEFPLVLVWDKSLATLPEGLKNVKRIASIRLVF